MRTIKSLTKGILLVVGFLTICAIGFKALPAGEELGQFLFHKVTMPVAEAIGLGEDLEEAFPQESEHKKPGAFCPIYNPKQKCAHRIYIREYENYRPPAGAPVFYVPFPNTLCMLGMGAEGPRVIYEAEKGSCTRIIEQLEER